jgi:hypothetical protein
MSEKKPMIKSDALLERLRNQAPENAPYVDKLIAHTLIAILAKLEEAIQ